MVNVCIMAMALLLGRPIQLVQAVYDSCPGDGVLAVAVVEHESQFKPTAFRDNGTSTDYGLFQLNSAWHPQYMEDLAKHISYGGNFLEECLAEARGDRPRALQLYHTGAFGTDRGILYSTRVLKIVRRLEWVYRYSWGYSPWPFSCCSCGTP